MSKDREDLETIELQLLLEGIFRHHGYDFRSYAPGSLKRRLWRRVELEGLATLSALQDRVLHDVRCLERLLADLSINVTAMFRDPGFFLSFREKVIPLMRTYPFVRVWNAGCSTGEEVFSMAILLEEEGLGDRSRIYATDINEHVLDKAQSGLFPLDKMRDYTRNYINSGGKKAFSEYYTVKHESASFHRSLVRQVVFSQHNLVIDRSFNEFNVILCRNVLIYFGKDLQDRVHELFFGSLAKWGILALGSKESIKFSRHEDCYKELVPVQNIYQRTA